MTLNMGYGIEIPYLLLIVLLSLTLQITTKLDRRVRLTGYVNVTLQ